MNHAAHRLIRESETRDGGGAKALDGGKGGASLYPLRLPRPIFRIAQIAAAVQHRQHQSMV